MAQWSVVDPLNVDNLLKRFRCSEPNGAIRADFQGVDALTGTQVQVYHQRLLQIGLPFRVNIRGTMEVSSDTGGANSMGFRLPPISVNPLLVHGMNVGNFHCHRPRTGGGVCRGASRHAERSQVDWNPQAGTHLCSAGQLGRLPSASTGVGRRG